MTMRVLVPVARDGKGEGAAELAFDLFAGEHVVLLHVINPTESGLSLEATVPSFPDGWYEAREEEAEEMFDGIEAAAAEHGVTVERRTELGSPARKIVEVAEEMDIDHVVMGSHGRKGVSRILLGSVAEQVVRRSPVPVTIAR